MNNIKIQLDKWYSDYIKLNKKSPTWGELVEKNKQLEEEQQ